MTLFIASIVLVFLFSVLWMVKQLVEISTGMGHLNHKFDSLIKVLERIEKNTESTSYFLQEESQAYQEWKDELDVSEADEAAGPARGVRLASAGDPN